MYQKTIVIGHLGKDPEMRYTPAGVPVTSFSVATSRKWTNQNGESQEKTTWFRVTCWRKTGRVGGAVPEEGLALCSSKATSTLPPTRTGKAARARRLN